MKYRRIVRSHLKCDNFFQLDLTIASHFNSLLYIYMLYMLRQKILHCCSQMEHRIVNLLIMFIYKYVHIFAVILGITSLELFI